MLPSTISNVFGMTRPGIEPRSPEPLANTLPISPVSRLMSVYRMCVCVYIYIYMYIYVCVL